MTERDNRPSGPGEPEPVDAEFEPAEPLLQDSPEEESPSRGKGGAGPVAVLLASVIVAAVAGGLSGYVSGTRAVTVEPAATGSSAGLSGLEDRIAALEQAPRPDAPDIAPAMERLDALESRIAALEARPAANGEPAGEASPELVARLRGIEDRLEQAVQDVETAGSNAEQALAAAQDARSAAAEAASDAARALDTPAPSAPIAADAAPDLAPRLESLTGRVSALETGRSSVSARIETLESALDATQRQAERALEAADEAARADPGSVARLAERALALAALRDAAAGEASFEAERAALARLWPGREELQTLAAHARSGVDDSRTLARSFPAEAILDASGGGRALFGLVRIRPAPEPGAARNDPARLVSDAEAALEEGDLASALSAVDRLDGPAAEAARDWRLAARARLEVDQAVAGLRAALSQAEEDAR